MTGVLRIAGFLALAVLTSVAVLFAGSPAGWDIRHDDIVRFWERATNPGPLSKAHATLDDACSACHTPIMGVDAGKCVSCHADNRALLQRQPTMFHQSIESCADCHLEHLGRAYISRRMDHVALARLGMRWRSQSSQSRRDWFAATLHGREGAGRPDSSPLLAGEEALVCGTCHQRQDRHQGQFGSECATCHATTSWQIARFAHPSPGSTECAQCHMEPPSHRMMHFEMVSKGVARQEHATVRECFLCHQTTSWNDIKGAGWYKHH